MPSDINLNTLIKPINYLSAFYIVPGGGIFKPVRTPWGVWFLASIKCVYDNDFHLSFYFICSTIFDIEMSHFVEFCYILSKAMYIVYNIYSLCILNTLLFPY